MPHTGEYRMETIGASGGYGKDSVFNGGRGARMRLFVYLLVKEEIEWVLTQKLPEVEEVHLW